MKPSAAATALSLLLLCACTAHCAATSVTVTPEHPVRGDVVRVDVEATPGQELTVKVRFSKDLQVTDRRYLLELKEVEIPRGPNSFTVKAANVENLVLAVRVGFWVSVTRDAVDGEAAISQGGVPPGRYDVQVKGDAAPGADEVTVEVTATTTVAVGADGRLSLTYDTSPIPAGSFDVDVGGVSRTVTLAEASAPPNAPPVARFKAPEAAAGETATFDASGSYDADGSVTGYVWDMGDGSTLQGITVTHTYGAPGLYTVVLTVVDDRGLTSSWVQLLMVEEPPNRPPIPATAPRRACYVGQLVGFSAYGSIDPDGRIASFYWDLGDGARAEGASVSHRYTSPGRYNATLVVTDEEGLSGEAEILVEVATPPEGATAWTELTAEGGATLELPCGGRVRLNSSEAAPVLFFVYPGNPHPEDGLPPGQVGGFIYLGVGDPDLVAWPIYLEMTHSTGDAEAGSLCLYHYASGWLQCGDTGERQGAVWARLSREELQGSALTIGESSSIAGATVRGLALSSHDAQPGEEVTASVEVVNTRGSDSVFTLTLEVDGEPRTLRTVHLAPGESRLINFTFSLDTPGLHTVGVGGAAVALTVSPAGLPDLTVSAPTSSQATAGTPQTLPFNVYNGGDASSGRFNVSLYVGDLRACTVMLGPLNPGEAAGSEFTWTPGSPGSYVVRVVVDEGDVVPEAFEGNNELVGAVEAKARLQEDSGEGLLVSGAVAAAAAALLLHRRPRQSSLLEASAGRPAATSRGSSTGASTATGSRAPHPTVNAVVTRPQRRLRSTRTSGADARL